MRVEVDKRVCDEVLWTYMCEACGKEIYSEVIEGHDWKPDHKDWAEKIPEYCECGKLLLDNVLRPIITDFETIYTNRDGVSYWNKYYPVGTKVKAFILGDIPLTSETESEAFLTDEFDAVISVKCRTEPFSLSSIAPIGRGDKK